MAADDTTPEDPTPSLVEQARAGSEPAFGELMRLHYETVFRRVHSVLRNEHDARDVCQEVWLKVWQELPRYRGEAKFTTWLHPIAVRRAIDHLRKRQRWYQRFLPFATQREDDGTEVTVEPAAPGPDREDDARAARMERFEEALQKLPPHHRAVLALREVDGLSYEEIAAAVGCPVGTVMSRLHHARRSIARQLKDLPCD